MGIIEIILECMKFLRECGCIGRYDRYIFNYNSKVKKCNKVMLKKNLKIEKGFQWLEVEVIVMVR